jgi:hypothetical protein
MKKWYESRLIWLGVGTVIMAGLSAADQGANLTQIGMAVIGAAMIVLRTVTDKGIGK